MARTGLNHLQHMTTAPLSETDFDNEPFPIPDTLQECADQLKAAENEVRSIVKESCAQRDAERRERIHQLEVSSAPKDKRSATLRRLQKAEDCKRLFAKSTRYGIPIDAPESHASKYPFIQIWTPNHARNGNRSRSQRKFSSTCKHGIENTLVKLKDHHSRYLP